MSVCGIVVIRNNKYQRKNLVRQMLFYIGFILLVVLCFQRYRFGCRYLTASNYYYLKFIGLALMVSLSIFRFDVGFDYSTYYEKVQDLDYYDTIERYEPISRLIMYIAHYLGHPQFVFIIFGLINYYFIIKVFNNYSPNFYISILVFISFFYLADMSVIRQAVAVSITLYGYKYIVSKSFVKYLLVCGTGMLFHSSAVIALPIYFIYNYFGFTSSIITYVCLFVAKDLVLSLAANTEYGFLIDHIEDIGGGGELKKYTNALWLVFMLICNMINRKKIQDYNCVYVIIIGIAFPFIFGGHIGMRIAEYYLIYFCLFIPYIYNNSQQLLKKSISFLLIAFFAVNVFINSRSEDGSQYVPYKTFFFQDVEHPKFRR